MEFNELQKIWDSQSNQTLYAINEQAMEQYIQSKMKQTNRITQLSELLTIVVNAGAGVLILLLNLFKKPASIYLYLMAGWMLVTAVYVLVSRIRRLKGNRQFDRSMQGDLRYAIGVATYQVRFSQLLRWNQVPIGLFCLLGIWESGKPLWAVGILLVFLSLTWIASGWEHGVYQRKKHALETLATKLAAQS